MILAINPKARVEIHFKQWQLAGDALKCCEVIVGGLDNVRGKDELDAFCRRFLIPYIDQGMDVHKLGAGHGQLVAGQVVLSEPGSPCLRCMGRRRCVVRFSSSYAGNTESERAVSAIWGSSGGFCMGFLATGC
jgi:hypothetical protein